MNAEKTNRNVTIAMIVLGLATAVPLLAVLCYWSWYMVRQVRDQKLESLAQIGMAGGLAFGVTGLMVIGLVLIDRLRVRRDASTSGEASPVPGLVLVFLGVVLAVASVLKGP